MDFAEKEGERNRCLKRAYSRLSRGDLTSRGMLSFLTEKNSRREAFSVETAKSVVTELKEKGFLDDKRYLRLVLRRADEKLLGPRKIREELVKLKFPPAYIEAALSRERDETARAASLLKREGKDGLARELEGKKKAIDFLVRKGYDYSTAIAAAERFSVLE